jgi:hypothetical protein
MRAGYGNFLGEFDVEFVLQGVNLLLELLFNFGKRVRHSFPGSEKNDAESGKAGLRREHYRWGRNAPTRGEGGLSLPETG